MPKPRTAAAVGFAFALAIAVGALAGGGGAASAAAPRNKSAPTLKGTSAEGSVLQADHGRWYSKAPVKYSYQWRRCTVGGTGCLDVPKATDQIYAVGGDDVGHTLRVLVTATNKTGANSATSAATGTVTALAAQAPHDASPPTISGSAKPGMTLTAAPGTWTGTAPIGFTYRWRRCDATGGACSDTLVKTQSFDVSAAEGNHALRVLVTATNTAGSGAALSDPTASVPAPTPIPAKPKNSSAPKISGTPQQGQRLRGDHGKWSNHPGAYDYFWVRCDKNGSNCADISGAHGSAYTLAPADVGHTIRFKVQAKNAAGITFATSVPTAVIAAPAKPSPPASTSPPTISGTAQEGKTLDGNRGQWSGSPTDYNYTWTRCDQNGNNCDGTGGHKTSYALTSADVGHTIRFRVQAKNAGGSTTTSSAPTPVVKAADKPAATSPPTTSGTPQEGRTLTGNKGAWTHNPTAYQYSWLRCDRNGGNCAAIGGARGTTYALTSADVGNTIRFRVTAANSTGSTTSTSVPTPVILKAVAPPPPPPAPPAGCPAGGNPHQVGAIGPPARLLVDALQSDPRVVTRGVNTLVVRFHVTSSCGGPVQGALVYATATPFNQFAIPPEQPTGADGWATLVFRRLRGFPVTGHQQLIAMFARARKPGESILGGISTRRLFSIPVDLGR